MEYPEKCLQVNDCIALENISQFTGKDLIFYDEHHGTAYRLTNASEEDIKRLYASLQKVVIIIL